MENVLQGLNNVCIYLDDIPVSGKTPEDHLYHLEAVLHQLRQAGLHLKHWKCSFLLPSVGYLGFSRYLPNAYNLHREKIQAVVDSFIVHPAPMAS